MEILFDFKGEIDNGVLRNILKTMDEKMAAAEEDRFVRKKINSILIECLQNLIFHAAPTSDPVLAPGITVRHNAEGYQIWTVNEIYPHDAEKLQAYLDRINSMSEEELRLYYQEVLTNGRFNPQGGAGLGLLNIARKTHSHKIEYSFKPSVGSNLTFQMHFLV